MKWDDLAILLAVSRSGSMTEAARRLSVDQTTVSRRLRALEASMGVALVVRERHGVSLTPAGVQAARFGEQMETAVHDLQRSMLGVDAELAGRLRVTTVEVVTHYHAELFTGFAQRYPDIELEVEASIPRRALARREADVALRWALAPDEGLWGRKLVHAAFAIYATCALFEAHNGRLEALPWVVGVTERRATFPERFLRERLPAARIVCRYEDSLSVHAAIRTGAGAGFMPCAFADPDPRLVRVGEIWPEAGFDVWCLTHPDLRATARVRSFLEYAGEYFGARRGLYAGA